MTTGAQITVCSRFSFDLVTNSLLHRQFLIRIHQLGVSLKPLTTESLRRYRDIWLPLVHLNRTKQLIPPPDVAWLWHCHRLAPYHYAMFISTRFSNGVEIEANPPFALQDTNSAEDCTPAATTRLLWEQAYVDEPFFLSEDGPTENSQPSSKENGYLGGFDLLGSTTRQSTFLWQVSGERFSDLKFLEQGRDNYYHFLVLQSKAAERNIILVPTYQIDLMWHTHILASVTKYNDDCKAIMGKLFHHNDSLNDRSEGSVLDVSYRATHQLWMDVYGEEYAVQGGMYRGEPPAAFFLVNWVDKRSCNLDRESTLSTSQEGPAEWANLGGKASDGSPAFIKVTVPNAEDLKKVIKKDNYVFGKSEPRGFGYHHLETREANGIIMRRLKLHQDRLESQIAMDQSCCGNTRNSSSIGSKEKELAETKIIYEEMKARSTADRPYGKPKARPEFQKIDGNQPAQKKETPFLYDDTGFWLYPPYLWGNCGGACGGSVAYNMSVAGGAGGGGECDTCCDGNSGGGTCGGSTDCSCDGGGACGGSAIAGGSDVDCGCCDGVDGGAVADAGAPLLVACCCPS